MLHRWLGSSLDKVIQFVSYDKLKSTLESSMCGVPERLLIESDIVTTRRVPV